jgi:hypothetical protein
MMVNEWIRANSPQPVTETAVTQSEADCTTWLHCFETDNRPPAALVQRAQAIRARVRAAAEALRDKK